MKVKYALIFVLIILSINLTGCFTSPSGPSIPEWTVMIYLDSDNNLESAGINDINEMEMVGSSSKVNIVVQADRIPGYDTSNSDWTTTRRYYIMQDNDPFLINSEFNDLGELNMGDPDETLIDFASWVTTNYPAKKYLLVIWNHGGGFRSPAYSKGIAQDDTSGKDIITMPDLEYALSAISVQMGKNIDIVGMDACLMAMTEVAYQIKDCADILVTSEENEPGDGWPYDSILAQLVSNPHMSPEQLAVDIVYKYIVSYPYDNVTQSAIDLSYMDDLAGQLSSMADSIRSDTLTSKDAYLNLYDFCSKTLKSNYVAANVRSFAFDVQQTLNSAVINSDYNGSGLSGSKGLSIYFPLYNEYDSENYNNTNFAQDTFWDEMLLSLGL